MSACTISVWPPIAAPLHHPFEDDRAQLPRAVDHGIAEVSDVHAALRMLEHNRILGRLYQETELPLVLALHQPVGLTRRDRHAGREILARIGEAPVTWRAPYSD